VPSFLLLARQTGADPRVTNVLENSPNPAEAQGVSSPTLTSRCSESRQPMPHQEQRQSEGLDHEPSTSRRHPLLAIHRNGKLAEKVGGNAGERRCQLVAHLGASRTIHGSRRRWLPGFAVLCGTELEVSPSVCATDPAGASGSGSGQGVPHLRDVWRGQLGSACVGSGAGQLPTPVHPGA